FNAYVDLLQQLLQQQQPQQQQQQGEQQLANKLPFVGKTITFFLPQLGASAATQFDALDCVQQQQKQQKQQQQQQEQQQQQQQRKAKQLVRPVYVHLHSLPLDIHRSQVEAIVENLYLRLTAAVEGIEEPLQEVAKPAPLLTPKNKEKQAMESLFQQQIDEVAFKDALYQQDIKYIA
ncbi:hypothetical protein, conserved, partial [Eimeria tenella]